MHRPLIDELKPFQPSWPTKRQTDILIFLAKEGKTDRYNLNKRTGISYGTIHYSLNKLMENQFVYISSEEKSKKGGTKSIFSLTSNGFMAALASGKLWRDLKRVLLNWSGLAPIFVKKIFEIKNKKVKEDIIKCVELIPKKYDYIEFYGDLSHEEEIIIDYENSILDIIFNFPGYFISKEYLEFFLSIDDVRNHVIKWLEYKIKNSVHQIDFFGYCIKVLNNVRINKDEIKSMDIKFGMHYDDIMKLLESYENIPLKI